MLPKLLEVFKKNTMYTVRLCLKTQEVKAFKVKYKIMLYIIKHLLWKLLRGDMNYLNLII